MDSLGHGLSSLVLDAPFIGLDALHRELDAPPLWPRHSSLSSRRSWFGFGCSCLGFCLSCEVVLGPLPSPLVRTPTDFTGFHTHLQVYESKITRIMKEIENTWDYKNQETPMIRPCTSAQLNNNLAKLLKNFFQINLNLTLFDIKLVYFVWKERLYL